MIGFRTISGWITEAPELQPPLKGSLDADVAIIGGGYTGLTAALALRERGASVAVLEKHFAGYGASGRNAGHLTPTIGKDLPSLITFFGLERARKLLHYAEAGIQEVERLIERHSITCDYVPSGNIIAAVHPCQEGRLRKAAEAGKRLGAAVEFLDGHALRDRGLPPAFTCGVLEPRGGILDPGKYVLGLRRAALEAGVRLFEGTAVQSMVDGARIRIETGEGELRAPRAVLATNAFTATTGRLKRALIPITVSLLVTEPLAPAQKSAIGWAGQEGIYTAHELLENYRWTADGRLMIGSKSIRFGSRGGLAPEQHPATAAGLERVFRDRFPEIADVAMGHYWSGHIALAMDFLPKMGVTGRHRNLFYSLAYAGHGLAQASYAGRALAAFMEGHTSAAAPLFNRFIFPVPPDPIRTLYARGLTSMLEALDRRVDARARSARQARAGASAPDASPLLPR